MIEGTVLPRKAQTARTPTFEEDVLHVVDRILCTSLLALVDETRRPRTNVHLSLQKCTALHPLNVERVLLFQPDDHPRRVSFPQQFVNQSATDIHFSVPCYSLIKQSFHVKGCLLSATHTCGN